MGLAEDMKELDSRMSTYGAARAKFMAGCPILADVTTALKKAKNQKEFEKIKADAAKKYKEAGPLLEKAESTSAAVLQQYKTCQEDAWSELKLISNLSQQYGALNLEILKLNKRIEQYNKDNKYNPLVDDLPIHPKPNEDALFRVHQEWGGGGKWGALLGQETQWKSGERAFPVIKKRIKDESDSLAKLKFPLKK